MEDLSILSEINRVVERPFAIQEIQVEDLFGQFTYDIALKDVDISTLLILYGDNGSGKTTILRLIFDLLDATPVMRYKSEVASVKFQKFSITLKNGTQIVARRQRGTIAGPYECVFRAVGQHEIVATFEERVPNKRPEIHEEHQLLFLALRELNLSLYFVGDDRSVRSSGERADEDDYEEEQFAASRRYVERRPYRSAQNAALTRAVKRLERYFEQQAMSGANRGIANANTIYADVVQGIAEFSGLTSDSTSIVETLTAEAKRSREYAEFGLASPLDVESMIHSLNDVATADRRDLIIRVLKPYVEGLAARHEAIQYLYDTILTFKSSLESFYHDKRVSFNFRTGIAITSPTGESLPPTALSSGEKQLLLLLCNTLSMQDAQSILIIDEPELSLNIKWQRRLVDTLLKCDRAGRVQFVLASHSMELLTLHDENVASLRNQGSAQGGG